MGLREIIISQPDEFGLTKTIEIQNIHIYIDKQRIEVSYAFVWKFETAEVKREYNHFILDDQPHLDYWDETLGATIEAGIRKWFE